MEELPAPPPRTSSVRPPIERRVLKPSQATRPVSIPVPRKLLQFFSNDRAARKKHGQTRPDIVIENEKL